MTRVRRITVDYMKLHGPRSIDEKSYTCLAKCLDERRVKQMGGDESRSGQLKAYKKYIAIKCEQIKVKEYRRIFKKNLHIHTA